MDTTTVLEIIKMLENKAIRSTNEWRAERIENLIQGKDPDAELHTKYLLGVADGVLLAVLHLQNYIEAQLNAKENKSTEQ
jgi:hypothetical protein